MAGNSRDRLHKNSCRSRYPKELWSCAKKYVGTSSKWVPNSGAGGNLETLRKKRFKKERHTRKPPWKKEPRWIWLPSTVWGSHKYDNQCYFLSRGQDHRRWHMCEHTKQLQMWCPSTLWFGKEYVGVVHSPGFITTTNDEKHRSMCVLSSSLYIV